MAEGQNCQTIDKKTIRIQIGVALTVLATVIGSVFVGAFKIAQSQSEIKNQVELIKDNQESIENNTQKNIEQDLNYTSINSDIQHIKSDVSEIKDLLKSRNRL